MAHANKQPPVAVRPNPRDADNRRTNQVKGYWRAAKRPGSLKAFVRTLCGSTDADKANAAHSWLFNKTANTSKPQLGLGNTHK